MIAPRTFALALAVYALGCDKKAAAPPTPTEKPDPFAVKSDAPAAPAPSPASGSAVVDAAANGVPTDATWSAYDSPAGFTITFPNKPVERENGGMRSVSSEFNATAEDDRQAACGLSALEITAEQAKDPRRLVEAAMKSHRASATKVVEDKEVTLDGAPGHALVFQTEKHQKWMRAYAKGNKLFFLSCGGPVDRAEKDGPIATKTIESLHLK